MSICLLMSMSMSIYLCVSCLSVYMYLHCSNIIIIIITLLSKQSFYQNIEEGDFSQTSIIDLRMHMDKSPYAIQEVI